MCVYWTESDTRRLNSDLQIPPESNTPKFGCPNSVEFGFTIQKKSFQIGEHKRKDNFQINRVYANAYIEEK